MALGAPVELASGLFSLNGYLNDPTPAKTGFSYGDPVGALTALSAALLAIREARRTGQGRCLDVSLRDALSFAGDMSDGAPCPAADLSDRIIALI